MTSTRWVVWVSWLETRRMQTTRDLEVRMVDYFHAQPQFFDTESDAHAYVHRGPSNTGWLPTGAHGIEFSPPTKHDAPERPYPTKETSR